MDASQSSRSSATERPLEYVSCRYLDLGQSGIFIDEKDDAEAGAVSCNRRGRAAPRPADLNDALKAHVARSMAASLASHAGSRLSGMRRSKRSFIGWSKRSQRQ